MRRDFLRCPLAGLIAFAAVALAAAGLFSARAAARTAEPPARIVAIGDLHGDYPAYLAILKAARLVDEGGRWTGGKAVLVQLGDIPDRGPATIEIIRHLRKLQKEAKRAGGKVVALVGNHEAMNMTGDLRYVHPGEYASFADANSERLRESVYEANREAIETAYRKQYPALGPAAARQRWLGETPLGAIEHQRAWATDGEIGRWVAANPAVAMIGDTLFVHGGISRSYAALPIEEINRRVASALKARETSPESILNDPAGPLWYRGLVKADAQEELVSVLSAYGAKNMVVGHTPDLGGVTLLHEGRLVTADTGISQAYGGPWTYVELIGDSITPHIVREARRQQAK